MLDGELPEIGFEALLYFDTYMKCCNIFGLQFCWPKDGSLYSQDLDVVLAFTYIKESILTSSKSERDSIFIN